MAQESAFSRNICSTWLPQTASAVSEQTVARPGRTIAIAWQKGQRAIKASVSVASSSGAVASANVLLSREGQLAAELPPDLGEIGPTAGPP